MEQQDISTRHTSKKAKVRLAKRYAFERRFKMFGILAILISAAALMTLVYTIAVKVAGVFTENYIVLDVQYDEKIIDPSGERKTENFELSAFRKLVRTTLRENFSYVPGGRQAFPLYRLLSDAAILEVRKHIQANPELIGSTEKFPLLADDVTNLYLKGYYGTLEKLPSFGVAQPVGTSDTIEVFVQSNSLNVILQAKKDFMAKEIRRLNRQVRAQQRGIDEFNKRILAAETDQREQDIAKFKREVQTYTSRRDALQKEVSDLKLRIKALGGEAALNKDIASFFLKINGGMVKVNKISPDRIEGVVYRPLNSDAPAQEGQWELLVNSKPENDRKISDQQIAWIEKLKEQGKIKEIGNWRFLTANFSREAEQAGVWGAVAGSFWTMMITLLLAFPIGVTAAIYLEEFAPKNWFTNLIEVNINNLAAVPSIIFGLLGLAFVIGVMGVGRSTPLSGGIVLALMTLPTIIIAARAAIKAVPPSIREAALGIGASKNQAVFHHVLPLAMPGILTGTIIGMAQALGETAPLLMIGMNAFVVDTPTWFTDTATAMPVQIFLMADFPETAFQMKTSAAIIVLLLFLVVMNAVAIFLRQRFERKW
ncbi:MAG: phosphate ABC transporter permease PstA [Pseudomonadota bacterium]